MSGTALAAGSERHRRLAPFRSQPAESPDVGNQRSDFRFQSDVLHDSVCLPQMIASLLQLAVTARAQHLDFADAEPRATPSSLRLKSVRRLPKTIP